MYKPSLWSILCDCNVRDCNHLDCCQEIIHRLRHLQVGRQRINLSGTVINMRKINYIGYGFKNGALTWSLSAYTINRFINHN